ncbi:PAQR family membrane homeostasis protein TrhA [Rubeoparvulum massiliense]|uniref:PAQR family membrane homeostasis protein TrhA n=1 Tax=Rubeoparvulum massiliense TaxID=1631346 RepID=UPI00065DD015|nr:hemolysin III family protein [Rubeoparvulum massiliense]
MNAYVREPINAYTHLGGAIFSFIALLAMVVKVSINTPSVPMLISVILFGLGMLFLYGASTVYHMIIADERIIQFFRRLDHSMIFALIAGSYAPFCLITLQADHGLILFILIHVAALLGILFKMVWFNSPRWLSTAIYIAMGWMIIFYAAPLADKLSVNGLFLLILGGIFYTIGGVIYATKPRWLQMKHMGFHEIFHIFVLLGSLSHFLCVYFYVI